MLESSFTYVFLLIDLMVNFDNEIRMLCMATLKLIPGKSVCLYFEIRSMVSQNSRLGYPHLDKSLS